jgi:signal transduction histidine kinase
MRITLKLTLAVFLAFTTVLAVNGWLRLQRENALFQSALVRELVSLGRATSSAAQGAWSTGSASAALRVIEAVRSVEPEFDVTFIPEGGLLALVQASGVETLRAGRSLERTPAAHAASIDPTVVDVPVLVDGALVGAIEVAGRSSVRDDYIHDSITRTVTILLITLLVCAALVFVLGAVLIQRPINALDAAAQRIGNGDLRTPVVSTARDELGDLGRSLEEMRQGLVRSRAQRLEAMEQLRHADRLSSVGTLASSMVHELGAPLQVVIGRAKMIERDEATSPSGGQNARIVREQAERITLMVRQLLDFSRSRTAVQPYALLAQAMQKTVALLEPIAAHLAVQITVTPPEPTLQVQIDEGHLQQVLMNLGMNALHAMSNGGTLTLAAHRLSDEAVLEVKDTGAGMSEDVRLRLFTPFFTTKPAGQGTGLGLTVALGIVTDAGGHIEVESAPGNGATFRIHLPVATTSGASERG